MRETVKSITLPIDGTDRTFQIHKLDAMSGVCLLRLLLRLQEGSNGLTILDLITSLSEAELKSVMTVCLNNVHVVLPAGPHPVMMQDEWGYPEIRFDTPACMRLLIESISFNLSGFFAESGSLSRPAPATTTPSDA